MADGFKTNKQQTLQKTDGRNPSGMSMTRMGNESTTERKRVKEDVASFGDLERTTEVSLLSRETVYVLFIPHL